MSKILAKFVLFAALFVFFAPWALAAELRVSAESAVLMDEATGKVIWEKNAHRPRPMASTTKVMTAIVALELGDLNDILQVGANAAGKDGSSMYLLKGEKIPLNEVLYGILLSSGNDACVAAAEYLCGSEKAFVERMNQKAAQIGARKTHFANTNGLPADNHYSSAYDLALITRYALKNPVFKKIVATKHHYVPATNKRDVRYMYNHNSLLWRYKYADGVKTGYTRQAGKCLVASGTKNGQTLIAVVLKSRDIYGDTTKMLEYGFNNYFLYKPWRLGKPLAYIKASRKRKIPLVASREIKLLLPKTWSKEKIKIKIKCPRRVFLPFFALQRKGWVEIYYEKKLLARTRLVAKYDS